MYPHRIHLAGPWQRIDHSDTSPLRLPVAWAQVQSRLHQGVVLRLRRLFQWPTDLLPHERLWLVLQALPVAAKVFLNEHPLAGISPGVAPWSVDITRYVRPRNVLELLLSPVPSVPDESANRRVFAPEMWQGGLLEVRRDIHLQALTGEMMWEPGAAGVPRLRLTADVSGSSPRPLAIVIRVNGTEELYQELPGLGRSVQHLDVATPPLIVPRWNPGQRNALVPVEIQLLDPACSLDQRAFACGFRSVRRARSGVLEVNGLPIADPPVMPWTSPFETDSVLAARDQAGKALILELPESADLPAVAEFLWHHPSIVDYSFANNSMASRKP